jgi:hypothetical protein
MFRFPVSKKLLFHYLRSNCRPENMTLAIKSGKVQKKNKKIHPLKFPPNERRQTVPFVCQGDANLLPLAEGEL